MSADALPMGRGSLADPLTQPSRDPSANSDRTLSYMRSSDTLPVPASRGRVYKVVFQDGPLGMEVSQVPPPGMEVAKVVKLVEGGQAAQGGVGVNDIVVAVDSVQAMSCTAIISALSEKQRPIAVSFRRPIARAYMHSFPCLQPP